MSKSFRDLRVWQDSVDLAVAVFESTKAFPGREQFGLAAHMRRTVVSVPSNIAEGQGRDSDRDWRRFLLQARGSLYELETQLMIARRLGFLTDEQAIAFARRTRKVGSALAGLLNYVSSRLQPTTDNRQPTTRHPS